MLSRVIRNTLQSDRMNSFIFNVRFTTQNRLMTTEYDMLDMYDNFESNVNNLFMSMKKEIG